MLRDAVTPENSSPIVPGRACGECTLCCKLLAIAELAKPRNIWCDHCKPRHGCAIYDLRPRSCATFYCGYLLSRDLGEEWKPSRCKIVLLPDKGNSIVAFVDPQRPDVWRREPYYSTLKRLSVNAAVHKGGVIVRIDRHTHVIFPDRNVDLGEISDEETVVTGARRTPTGLRFEAYKVHRDDPRAIELMRQQSPQDPISRPTTQ